MKLLVSLYRAGGGSRWGLRLLLLAGLGAASCEAPATQQASTTPTAPPPQVTVPDQPPVLPTPAQLGYHRYVGTIGGRSVLAETTLSLEEAAARGRPSHAEWAGSFYYRTTGREESLGSAARFRPDQWLETYYHAVAVLCAEQPPGELLLTGCYWPDKQQPALPLRLRESYSDGVRYELLQEKSYGPACRDEGGKLDSASVRQIYLHLLGPDTLRPALARLQCPPPAARRRARLARAARLGPNGYYRDFLEITLNEGSLLAYTHDSQQGIYSSRYDLENSHCYLVDLRTGRPLSLVAQLRPGGLRQVQRLLSRQALAKTATARQRDHWWDAGHLQLPAAGFEVNPTGWRAHYSEPEDADDSYNYGQDLSWVTLRPLVRPASPLGRLLRIRGL